jgi:DNA-binding XRE family transcriptional regulator
MLAVVQPEVTVTIPNHVLAVLGWDGRTPLSMAVQDGALVLRPIVEAADRPIVAEPTGGGAAPAPGALALQVVEARLGLGFTRSELALLLDTLPNTVAAWEDGTRVPDASVLTRLAEALEKPDLARDAVDRALDARQG